MSNRKMKCTKCGRVVKHRLIASKDLGRFERGLRDWTPYRHASEYRRGNEMNTRICGD